MIFELPAPSDWTFYPDEHGGSWIPPCQSAVLHVHAELVSDPAELPNLTRMLAGFLTQHHRPVATDELLPIKIPEALCFSWQYMEIAPEGWERVVRLWIVGNEKAWAFVNFQLPLTRMEALNEVVDGMIRGFRFRP